MTKVIKGSQEFSGTPVGQHWLNAIQMMEKFSLILIRQNVKDFLFFVFGNLVPEKTRFSSEIKISIPILVPAKL